MILKSIDLIRKFKKDKADKKIDWIELEMLAIQFDKHNKLEWEKFEINKSRSDLKNEKLKIEIEKLKQDKLFTTSKGTSFKISEVESIKPYKGTFHKYIVQLSTKNKTDNWVALTEEEYQEFLKMK